MKCSQRCSKGSSRGFTRVELVVLLATLALLATVTRPVWGKGGQPRSVMCMDNLRRLSAAGLLYTEDSGGEYAGNYHGQFTPGVAPGARPWVAGFLDWSTAPDNTNTVFLTDSRYAALAPYLGGDASAYRCPDDEYVSAFQARRWASRVRSYAMNCFLGEGNQATFPLLDPGYAIYRKPVEFRRVSPRQVFVFLEEHLDSLTDGLFWAPNSPQNWVDFPGSLHDGAAWFTYADGHVELRRWVSSQTVRPVSASGNMNMVQTTPNDPDLVWWLEHASEPK